MGKMWGVEKCEKESNFNHKEDDNEEGEEEILSLIDLPVDLKQNEIKNSKMEDPSPIYNDNFDFGSSRLTGSIPTEPAEMCAAEDVFFKGQILPLRHSFSSDSIGLSSSRLYRTSSRSMSRSDSMDHGSVTMGPFSSRSSSGNSDQYYSSTFDNNTRTRNQFLSAHHPSPKPQIRTTRPVQNKHINSKSSMWDFFKIGLVRAPEIDLQGLKIRRNTNTNRNSVNSVSRNSSSSSSNSSSSTRKINVGNPKRSSQETKTEKLQSMFLLSGCKCSVSEIVPLNSNIAIMKNVNADESKLKDKRKSAGNGGGGRGGGAAEEEEKVELVKGKQALLRHRTFEWLKELPHASYVDEP